MSSALPNYIRTYRKRAHLTQEDVAFLLGCKSTARICRHERSQQAPNLETLLAYEVLFGTPVRNLFSGVHHGVENKLKNRIRLLIRNLGQIEPRPVTAQKLELLAGLLAQQGVARRV